MSHKQVFYNDLTDQMEYIPRVPDGQPVAVPGLPLTFDKTFTDAQIKANHTTPLELVPAPGAGFAVIPLAIYELCDTAAGGYTTSGNQLFAAWGSSSHYAGFTMKDSDLTGTAVTPRQLLPDGTNAPSNSGYVPQENAALVLDGGADYTGGNVANSLRVVGQYMKVPV